jgi:hypothetical protein
MVRLHFLTSMWRSVEEPQGAMIVEKRKVIFLLDSGACFSVLPYLAST